MAEAVIQQGISRTGRLRALILPREHGAWGMLLIPLLSGAAVGWLTASQWQSLLLLTLASLALFWMRTPMEAWLGTTPMRAQTPEERRAVLTAAGVLAAVAAACIVALVWVGENLGLLAIGGGAAVMFVSQMLLRKLGRATRMWAQLVGAAGLTCTAPAAYYVITGQLDGRAFSLWLANWLFAGNQIHFVQLRIRAARATQLRERLERGRSFLLGQLGMVVSLALAWKLAGFPALAALAFVPAWGRGCAWFVQRARPLHVHRLGWSELTQAVLFGVLLVVAFALG